jgi:hypothetical protein
VHGGDRLPWVRAGGENNFDSLSAMTWQVHVYGQAGAELAAWCEGRGLPLRIFSWRPDHEAAGLARDALYLLRPDTYVGLAADAASPDALDDYFAAHGMRPAA